MTLVLDNYDSFTFGQPEGKAPRTVPGATSAPALAVCSACGAHSPRADGARRFAPRTIVSCGEGKPLPAPLPRGASRGERMQDDSR